MQPYTIVSGFSTKARRVMEFYAREESAGASTCGHILRPPRLEASMGILVAGRLEHYRRYQDVIRAARAIKMPQW